jgi:hypothetical protein
MSPTVTFKVCESPRLALERDARFKWPSLGAKGTPRATRYVC